MLPDPIRQQLLTSLRVDVPGIVLGCVMLLLGVTACVLGKFAQSKRAEGSRDAAAFWFGIFAAFYGLRLFAENGTMLAILNVPRSPFLWAAVVITYFVPIPGMLFVGEVFPAWSGTMRRLVGVQCGLAIVELAVDIGVARAGAMSGVNNVVVLAAIAAFLVALWRTRVTVSYARPVGGGLAAFCCCAVVANLSGLGFFSLPINVEQFGFAVFIATLGRVVVLRALGSAERLAALDQELQIARRMQLSILPQGVPGSDEVRIAARYLPMKEVGGDFYDFLSVDEKHIGILIADVSGHGIPAALIASMVKVAIASQKANASNPARLLEGMNEALCGRMKGQFVTAAYLYLDLVACKLRYAAAGHPPLLRGRGALVEPIQQNGFALGFSTRSKYQEVEMELRSGDRFLLYTDGLFEAHNEALEEFGMERLRVVLAGCADRIPEECVTAVLEAVSKWAGYDRGRPAEDDLTVVAVEVTQ